MFERGERRFFEIFLVKTLSLLYGSGTLVTVMDDTKEEKKIGVEEILEQMFDFSQYSEEEKNELIEKAADLITEAAFLRALDNAGEETQKAFEKLMEDGADSEEVANFVQENLPDFEHYLVEEIEIFRDLGMKTEKEEEDKENTE